MGVCNQCGHDLGIGRFCTNCGHPVGGGNHRGDAPVSAPPAVPTPAPARHPGDADEASTAGRSDTDTVTETSPAPDTIGRHRHVDESRRHGAAAGWVPWVVGLTVMLLLAGLGLWQLLGSDDQPATTQRASEPVRVEKPSRDPRTPQGRATVSPEPELQPGDLAGAATVQAPAPAPPTQDVTGSPVSFIATNLLDGVPETCWRMPGDGTGESLTFSFDGPTEMTEVGLVNGYAKTASDASGSSYDWYAGNRRTLQVEWTFDDGTVVTQDLEETREMQSIGLDEGVVTEQVTLRLLEVTPPGTGNASRDYTAISEVRLLGAPTR